MFQVFFHGNTPTCKKRFGIAGCPSSGIAAVDFRRTFGVPEEPNDSILLNTMTFTDEQFVRENRDIATREADIIVNSLKACQANEAIPGRVYDWSTPVASPESISAYCGNPSPETAKGVILSVLAINAAERDKASRLKDEADKAEANRNAAIASARELLKDELAKKDSRIAYLEGELAEAREKIKELENEEAEA